jgi:hypothetical protein
MDERMSFLPHIEAIISRSSRMLGFIKRISREFHDPYNHETLYTFLQGRISNMPLAFGRITRITSQFIRYAVRRLAWRVWPLPAYDARCLLIGLEVLSDSRIVAIFLSARDILAGKVDCAYFHAKAQKNPNFCMGGYSRVLT